DDAPFRHQVDLLRRAVTHDERRRRPVDREDRGMDLRRRPRDGARRRSLRAGQPVEQAHADLLRPCSSRYSAQYLLVAAVAAIPELLSTAIQNCFSRPVLRLSSAQEALALDCKAHAQAQTHDRPPELSMPPSLAPAHHW